MISAVRLFLVPAVGSLLLLLPVLGIFLYIIVVLVWISRNQEDLKMYFKGMQYRQNETSEDELERLK